MYDAIFKDTYNYDSKPYWLASSGINILDSQTAIFGIGAVNGGEITSGCYELYRAENRIYHRGFGIRPVISLKSNITINDIQVTEGTEDTEVWPEHTWPTITNT